MLSDNDTIQSFVKAVGLSPFDMWVILGFVGQSIFTARFVVQWIVSEKKGESVLPVSFWFLSIAGSSIVLIYAVYRRDPVFIFAYGFGNFIYFRNLILVYRKKREMEAKVQNTEGRIQNSE